MVLSTPDSEENRGRYERLKILAAPPLGQIWRNPGPPSCARDPPPPPPPPADGFGRCRLQTSPNQASYAPLESSPRDASNGTKITQFRQELRMIWPFEGSARGLAALSQRRRKAEGDLGCILGWNNV